MKKTGVLFTYGGANDDAQKHLDAADELVAMLVTTKVPLALATSLVESHSITIPIKVPVRNAYTMNRNINSWSKRYSR